ncbi:MAG: hypothetical protein ABSA29_07260 [Terriglobales bacterium]|jgi:hypothetical protein
MDDAPTSDEEAPHATTIAAVQEARAGGLPSFRDVAELLADLNADNWAP